MASLIRVVKGRWPEGDVIAFEDSELIEWLIEQVVEGSGGFLSALAETTIAACPEDYSLLRPALMSLKRKYLLTISLSQGTGS